MFCPISYCRCQWRGTFALKHRVHDCTGNSRPSVAAGLWTLRHEPELFSDKVFSYHLASIGHSKYLLPAIRQQIKHVQNNQNLRWQISFKFKSQFKQKVPFAWWERGTQFLWCKNRLEGYIFWNLAVPYRWKLTWKCSNFRHMKTWLFWKSLIIVTTGNVILACSIQSANSPKCFQIYRVWQR